MSAFYSLAQGWFSQQSTEVTHQVAEADASQGLFQGHESLPVQHALGRGRVCPRGLAQIPVRINTCLWIPGAEVTPATVGLLQVELPGHCVPAACEAFRT